jgi:phosphatidylglycerol:prolipoprotein diacylglycerol transferase
MPQLILPVFNPNIMTIGPIQLRWYSLAYILGIIFGQRIIRSLDGKYALGLNRGNFYDDLLTYMVIGVVVGGRIGYMLFYSYKYLMANPLEVFALWHGGMSFHGGFLGVLVAARLLCRKYGIKNLFLLDLLASVCPIGLFFGRMANFINLELYGRPTDMPWGMVFPGAGSLARHPSQLYEAFLEGLVILMVMFWLGKRKKFELVGLNSGVFLLLYSTSRIFVEVFREPDQQLGTFFGFLTMGQVLSMPLFIAGIIILRHMEYRSHAIARSGK